MKVKDVALRGALSCDLEDSVYDVARKLREEKERHVVVTEDGKPVGIISTTDINNRLVAEGKDAKETKASEIMTSPIIVVGYIEESLAKIQVEMLKHNVFSCPVTDNGVLKGTLDLRDSMNLLSKEKLSKE